MLQGIHELDKNRLKYKILLGAWGFFYIYITILDITIGIIIVLPLSHRHFGFCIIAKGNLQDT